MKLSAKIFMLTGGLVSALVVACAVTLLQSRSAQAENEQTYHAETLATGYLAEAAGSMWAMRLGTAQFRTLTDPVEKDKLVASGKTHGLAFEKTLAQLASLPLDAATLAKTAQAKAAFAQYTDARGQWFDLSIKGASTEAEAVRLARLVPTASAAVKSLEVLVDTIRDSGKASYLQRNAEHTHQTNAFLGVGGLAVVVATLLSWLLLRSFSSRMAEALAMAQRMKALDLSAAPRTAADDELGEMMQALDAMREHMSRVVASVRENSQSVSTSSDEIARGSMDLSQRTEEQASGLQQTAASMEQLASTVQLNASNAKQANTLALGASKVAAEGGRMVGEVMATMKGIDDSSKKITEIIGVIDGIAFQTNILALNAAVEAARAGEQGRGFAVVASEVRSLSKRSADAAKEVRLLINTSAERVAQGNVLVERTGAIMQDIVASIRGVADINNQISDATVEQSAGMSQINEAVGHMDSATQQNAALVEQSAAAAESLKHQAATLVSAVAVFQVDLQTT